MQTAEIFQLNTQQHQPKPTARRSRRTAQVSQFPPIHQLEADLFSRATKLDEVSSESNWRVLLAGFEGYELDALRKICSDAGVPVTASFATADHLAQLSAVKQTFTHMIVNEGAFRNAESVVDRIIDLRANNLDIAILLHSPRSSSDDFGPERDILCDGTFGAVLTAERVKAGLRLAAEKVARRTA